MHGSAAGGNLGRRASGVSGENGNIWVGSSHLSAGF